MADWASIGEICPVCSANGLHVRLRLHQLNWSEAMWACPTEGCVFPIEGGGNDIDRWVMGRNWTAAVTPSPQPLANGNSSSRSQQLDTSLEADDYQMPLDLVQFCTSDKESVGSRQSVSSSRRGDMRPVKICSKVFIGDDDSDSGEEEPKEQIRPAPVPVPSAPRLEKVYARKPVDQLFAKMREQKRNAGQIGKAGGIGIPPTPTPTLKPSVSQLSLLKGYSPATSQKTSPAGSTSGDGPKSAASVNGLAKVRREIKQKQMQKTAVANKSSSDGSFVSLSAANSPNISSSMTDSPQNIPPPPNPTDDFALLDELAQQIPHRSDVNLDDIIPSANVDPMAIPPHPIDFSYLDDPHLVTEEDLEFLSL